MLNVNKVTQNFQAGMFKNKANCIVGKMLSNPRDKDAKYQLSYRSIWTLMQLTAKQFNINYVIFYPKDIHFERATVDAYFCETGVKLTQKEIPIPRIVDNVFYQIQEDEKGVRHDVDRYLEKIGCVIMRKNLGLSKEKTFEVIEKSDEYKDLIIPYKKTADWETVEQALSEWGDIVIKPNNGVHGHNIVRITKKDGDKYEMSLDTVLSEYDLAGLKTWWNELESKDQCIQKYIDARTSKGEPFDFRVRSVKDLKGNFVCHIYPRVGSGKGHVSNIDSGGYTLPLEYFLKQNFENPDDIKNQLTKFGNEFPKFLEPHLANKIFDLGLDITVCNENGNIKYYMFEANSFPGFDPMMDNAADALHMCNTYFNAYLTTFLQYINKPNDRGQTYVWNDVGLL
ncbi:MAG: YheC/YheD family protein [Ruminococcus sp.]|jgi:glutathione synthase/RimK-type ligase-like ATP-grasp enzyme|nr:YheC/YheD family protein [Ruminococcus sp.]